MEPSFCIVCLHVRKFKKKMFEREKLFVFVSVFVYFVEGHTLKMEAFNKVESTIFRCAVSTSFYCHCPSLLCVCAPGSLCDCWYSSGYHCICQALVLYCVPNVALCALCFGSFKVTGSFQTLLVFVCALFPCALRTGKCTLCIGSFKVTGSS